MEMVSNLEDFSPVEADFETAPESESVHSRENGLL